MSDDKLKKIMEKRYKKVVESNKKEPKEVAVVEDPTIVYVPYTDEGSRNSYILKLNLSVKIEKGFLIESAVEIDNASELHEKIIAIRHPMDQQDLKYFYNKSKKIGGDE